MIKKKYLDNFFERETNELKLLGNKIEYDSSLCGYKDSFEKIKIALDNAEAMGYNGKHYREELNKLKLK